MPEETITIGGKNFEVACQPGEEHFLQSAARMLDSEARALMSQIGRLPENRMLLMAGLMLADKTASFEERLLRAEEDLIAARAELDRLRSQPRERVEVPAIPSGDIERMAVLAAQAEALAQQLESVR